MQVVRWLFLSGLVFAALIPAGWQMGPKDLDDTSRYGVLVELAQGNGWCGQGLSQQLSPLRYLCCQLSRLWGYCDVPVYFVFILTSSPLALYQPTQGHCHVPPRIFQLHQTKEGLHGHTAGQN